MGQGIPVPEAYQPLSDAQIDQLLGPIALYPDPLLAQILEGATLPAQIVLADRYVSGGGDVRQISEQLWDQSVQALAHYPTVLKYMDDNLSWTAQVGQVFVNQQQAEMASIQRLRASAYSLGNLKTNQQELVTDADDEIDIDPADDNTMYVPDYQSDQVYSTQGSVDSGYTNFGDGYPIGLWLDSDFDWGNSNVRSWNSGYSRPANYWHTDPRQRDRSHTSIRETNRPEGMEIDRGQVPRSNTAMVQRADVRYSGDHAQTARPESRPAEQRPVARTQDTPGEVRPEQRVEPQPEQRPQVERIPERQYEPRPEPSEALHGSENAHETRAASSRGQESLHSSGAARGGGGGGGGHGGGKR
jgi:hypothetical protein